MVVSIPERTIRPAEGDFGHLMRKRKLLKSSKRDEDENFRGLLLLPFSNFVRRLIHVNAFGQHGDR